MTRVAVAARHERAAAALGDVLRAAGYGPGAIDKAAGPLDPSRTSPGAAEASLLRRRLPADAGPATLLRLFLCGEAVPAEDTSAALRPLSVDELVSAGVLGRSGPGVRSRRRIGWCDGVLVASDWDRGRRMGRDHVPGVGAGSVTLADLTVRSGGGRGLDLGTGGGVQALLTARHAEAVVGTDVSPRALEVATVSAALNGTKNIEWRQGSLFEPVAEERFDLVTANPPFVVSPEVAHVFRDGGLVGDTISRQVLRDAAAALRPGGWASVLCSWIHPGTGDWSGPVREWLADTGCDAWILRHRSQDPETYATVWTSQGGGADGDARERMVDRWLAYYADLGIETLATGAVVLHRRPRPGRGRVWSDDMPDGPSGPAGAQIVRAFEHRTRLAARAADVLDAVLVPIEGATLDQSLVRRDGAYDAAAVTLRLQPGLGMREPVLPDVLPVLLAADGQRSTAELIAATGSDGSSRTIVRGVRRLLELGLLGWRS